MKGPYKKPNPSLSHIREKAQDHGLCAKSSDHQFKCLMVKIMHTNIYTHCSWCSRPIMNVMYEFFNIMISWCTINVHFEENEINLNTLLQVIQSVLNGRTSIFSYYIMLRNEETWMYVLALSLTHGAKTQRNTQYALDEQLRKSVSIKYYIIKASALSTAILTLWHPTCKCL